MRIFNSLLTASLLAIAVPVSAATVNIDLSGATTGALINGVGGDFSQIFTGQTVAGSGVTGSPTGPLSLAGAGSITVAFFDPGVSAASNSLLSQPGNAAPLSLLLDSDADSLAFTAGFFNGGSVTADFFSGAGALVGSRVFSPGSDYHLISVSGLGVFRGITFRNNDDDSGLRFQNFSYNSVNAVPEPAGWALMILGFGLAGAAVRGRATKVSLA